MFHRFATDISNVELPRQFTFPFHYIPHPLTLEAARLTQEYISGRTDWGHELAQGKMFGVLVVRRPDDGEVGFVAAFSGNLAGTNRHDFFVPPVFDMLDPKGRFKTEENEISKINAAIAAIENSADYTLAHNALDNFRREAADEIAQAKLSLKTAKQRRDQTRQSTTDPAILNDLVRQSQHEKAELKRLERRLTAEEQSLQQRCNDIDKKIHELKHERRQRSAVLQRWLFAQFKMLNANGEERTLNDIFSSTPSKTPPSGAGECAAPKMLQYAYLHGLQPIAMGEFWWGASPKGKIRHHGHFYPACHSKCRPILRHMLQGLDVEADASAAPASARLEVVYDDPWIAIVNKPAGLLSVPGTEPADSVYSRAATMFPEADGPLVVHRLDMATSGLIVIAKDNDTHALMQSLFEKRQVKKCYVALLSGSPAADEGIIDLPLRPDFDDRPRQMVCHTHGKRATTRYRVVERMGDTCRVELYPLTGRTHQLRVHTAHPDGLGCHIVGDFLYGTPSERLYLHAKSLSFVHPITKKALHVTCNADF